MTTTVMSKPAPTTVSDNREEVIPSVIWSELQEKEQYRLITRSAIPNPEVRETAAKVCAEVAKDGDQAMERLAECYGGGFGQVPITEIEKATETVTPEVIEAIESAIANISRFHQSQRPEDEYLEPVPGVSIARLWTPLRRVGAYIPGGKAAYPSTVLMTAVPARIAKVSEFVVATPTDEEGQIHPALLAACHLSGVREVWGMGGAQAIAAMAQGTESVRSVDKIVGPGNAWVTAAKLEVLGLCAIDMPAGPSEVMVLADHTAHPRLVALDLLCQAEHGPDSPAILITDHAGLVSQTQAEIADLLPGLERREILSQTLKDHGMIILVEDINTSVGIVNRYAPEHVSIHTASHHMMSERVQNAGSVYEGDWSPESAGDYASGANHVLPTGAQARAYSPLSVTDFGSWRQLQRITEDGLRQLEPTICTLAETEGLTAHALAVTERLRMSNELNQDRKGEK